MSRASFRWPSIFLTHLRLTFLLINIQTSGKYLAKGPTKHLEVLKNELDKMAIKLNYMKLDLGVIMEKIVQKTFNQWLLF